jgi:phosphoribosylaminoimidazolecarboxamide formyltransferase/IMP cyclohydrolase
VVVIPLRYGLNPQQASASLSASAGGDLPLSVWNGRPSMINILDALQGWRLVREADGLLDLPVAASIKHLSPAGVAAPGPIDRVGAESFAAPADIGGIAAAYVRARDCDPRSSYGDMVAVSRPVGSALAEVLAGVVSDGIVAPGYDEGVVGILARKKKGSFLVLEMDPTHESRGEEIRDVFGLRLSQEYDRLALGPAMLGEVTGALSDRMRADALLGLVTVRYTQSNAVAYLLDGATIGVGAGQQSRVDCVELAGRKADRWRLRRHPRVAGACVADGVSRQERVNLLLRLAEGDLTPHENRSFPALMRPFTPALALDEQRAWLTASSPPIVVVSDAYLPFRDNVDVAVRHGARAIVEGGGSRRSPDVDAACEEHGVVLVRTGLRLFSH